MHASADLAVVILAGGEATRLPGKLAKPAGDVPMLVHVYRNLEPAGRPIYLSLKEPLPPELAEPLAGCTPVYDLERKRGPVGGLVAALRALSRRYAFVCAGDAPLVGVAHLARLLDAWREGDQAVVPVRARDGGEQWEPLAALYDARAFASAAATVLREGRGSMREVIERLRVRLLPMDDDAIFTNVNTPQEYATFLRSRHDACRSAALFERSKRVIPGGVNSPVRAFRAVGGVPRFVERGQGAYVYDVDGNRYVDYVGSWGPLILGHAHPDVVRALQLAAVQGSSFGAPTQAESQLAELVVEMVPSVELVRFVSSGTEAAMSALRLARGYTGRDKVVKFDGCYHGHADAFLVNAGSGALTFGSPDSPGVTAGTARDTLTATYNDLESVRRLFAENPEGIACVIVEPYAGNMGLVLPKPGFLEGLREITRAHGALLIFDEVITGFRVARGGAQEREGVVPDLTTLGKVIGGGLPVGAFGGREEIMARLSPLGPVYQAGTLSGNPLAMAAGIATLRLLRDGGIYARLDELGARLESGLREAFQGSGTRAQLARRGSVLCAFFAVEPVTDLVSAKRSDTARYAAYFHAMLERGVWLAPSQFEVSFVSLAHAQEDIDATIAAAKASLAALGAPA